VEIRPAEATDARAIAAVHVASWRAAYVGLVPDAFLAGLSVDEREGMWRDNLAKSEWPARGTLVLLRDAAVVGFASVGPSRDDDTAPGTGELWAIYLHPDAWGTGCGRRLMSEALARLDDAGFDRATLWVLTGNDRARRFYEAAGWSADGAVRTETRPRFVLNEVRYVRTL
jgi:ribosomal protein S18 acetylase RimI-like enzyme